MSANNCNEARESTRQDKLVTKDDSYKFTSLFFHAMGMFFSLWKINFCGEQKSN